MSAGFMLAGMGLSMLGNYSTQKEQKKRDIAALREQKLGAISDFSSIMDSANIMKWAAEEEALNVIAETERVGSAKARELKGQITKARSQNVAKTEGVTAGISKGKQAIAFEVKANKIRADLDEQEQSQINKVLASKDKIQNDINNKLYNAERKLKGILAQQIPSTDSLTSFISIATSGVSGGLSGYQIGQAFTGDTSAATSTT